MPKAGTLLMIDRDASIQFAACPFVARMMKPQDWPATWDGWVWLNVYQLDSSGDALEQRSIYVNLAGMKPYVPPTPR